MNWNKLELSFCLGFYHLKNGCTCPLCPQCPIAPNLPQCPQDPQISFFSPNTKIPRMMTQKFKFRFIYWKKSCPQK